MRYVYRHSPKRLEELVDNDDGKLNQRYLSTLDDSGNGFDQISVGRDNFSLYGDRKYSSAYEFDSAGNWIKRIT